MDRAEGKISLLAKGGALRIGINRTPSRASPKGKVILINSVQSRM